MTAVPAKRRAEARRLTLLCAAVYFCSYLTRLDYGAVMVEMVRAEGFSRVDASAALTGLFITYGFGQLISGYLGDRVKPQLLIFFGLIACGLMNLLIPFCPSPAWMTVVWSVNGLAQAMMWPPLVRIMSQHMTESEYKVATVHVSWGSSLGTIVIYLMIPLLLKVSSWRGVFYCAAAVGMGMAAFWMARYGRVERTLPLQEQAAPAEEPGDAGKSGGGLRALMPLLAIMMGVIICQGTLRDGITTWMPTYLADTYHMESGKSILTGVLLPLFGMVCYQIVLWMNRKLVENELQCAAIIFGLTGMNPLNVYAAGIAAGAAAAARAQLCAVGADPGLRGGQHARRKPDYDKHDPQVSGGQRQDLHDFGPAERLHLHWQRAEHVRRGADCRPLWLDGYGKPVVRRGAAGHAVRGGVRAQMGKAAQGTIKSAQKRIHFFGRQRQ